MTAVSFERVNIVSVLAARGIYCQNIVLRWLLLSSMLPWRGGFWVQKRTGRERRQAAWKSPFTDLLYKTMQGKIVKLINICCGVKIYFDTKMFRPIFHINSPNLKQRQCFMHLKSVYLAKNKRCIHFVYFIFVS